MKTRTLLLGFVLAAGAIGGAGCLVDNRASVQMQAMCSTTDDCTFSDTCDLQFIGRPAIDRSQSTDGAMWLPFQVANQLLNNADAKTGRTNTNDAHVDEAYIEYDGAALPPMAIGMNQRVPAEGTAVIGITVVPGSTVTLAALPTDAEMVAHIRLRGYYDNGSRFETGDFPLPIYVCTSGCGPVCTTPITCGYAGQMPASCP